MLLAGLISLSSLAALILFERTSMEIAEALLAPWFAICRALTPLAWQVRGNILLGLMWLSCGIIVYSMMISAAAVGLVVGMEKLRRPNRKHDKVSDCTA